MARRIPRRVALGRQMRGPARGARAAAGDAGVRRSP